MSICFTTHGRAAGEAVASSATSSAQAPALAATAPPVSALDVAALPANSSLRITVGHTQLLECASGLKRVYVGSPAVLHTFSQGTQELLVTAKTPGLSSLVLWKTDGSRVVLTVQADLDTQPLQAALAAAFPAEQIEVAADQEKLVLSGSPLSTASREAAYKLALQFSKDVVDTMCVVVAHPKQVKLKLRIVEVDRTKLEQFGLNFFSDGNNTTGLTTQQFGATSYGQTSGGLGGSSISVSNPLSLLFYSASSKAGVTVQDLEQKDILQVLSEPTLTTISGLPAKFLSGGEFPVPVVQGGTGNSTAITIVYRPYGVKVDFTPTVNADGTIRLKVSPEVSTLDYSNAVTISGFTIPALSTRRAETRRARPGRPRTGPILGERFRSKNLDHSVVELVVVVTASIVDPLTKPEEIHEPQPVVPYLNGDHFDHAIEGTTGPVPQPNGGTP